jgi:DNA gyrase subunit A
VKLFRLTEENVPLLLRSSGNRAILIDASQIPEKSSRSTQGVNAMTIKTGQAVVSACIPEGDFLASLESYRIRTLPAVGKLAKELEDAGQLSLI